MGKLTLDDLRKLREDKKREMSNRDAEDKDIKVIIGMGTCGIAAGAKKTMSAFMDSIEEHKLDNVLVRQTGCMGCCNVEPTVEVIMPDMPATLYSNVDEALVKTIIEEHIIGKKLVDEHVQDRPSVDIIEKNI